MKIKNQLKKVIFLLLGMSSTCSCVAFVGMGFVISLYTITLIIAFVILLTGKKQSFDIMKHKSSKYFFLWSFMGLFSSAFGLLYFANEDIWQSASLSFLPKVILYFILFCLLAKSRKREIYTKAILNGLIYGIIINLCWSVADAVIYYNGGKSITNELFKSYIIATNTRFNMLSLTINGVIRSGGLNGDPANIGMFAAILASYSLYSKKYWMYVLVIFSIFSSVSITALMCTIIITIIYLLSNVKTMAIGVFTFSIILIGGYYIYNSDNEVSFKMISAVENRLEDKQNADKDNNARSIYWLKFIPAVINSPTSLFIGTGYNTASYAYIKNKLIKADYPYDPEQTYFSFYFDIGLLGLLFFIFLHFHLLRAGYKKIINKYFLIVFAGMEGIMISFMGYHYTLYSVAILFLIGGTVLVISENKVPSLLVNIQKSTIER